MSKKKKKARARSKKSMQLKLKAGTAQSLAQLSFFVLSGLTLVSFYRRGLVLQWVNDLLINSFSWTSLFIPYIFLTFAFLVSKFKTPLGQPNVVVGSILLFLSTMSLFRAGLMGQSFWGSVAALLTTPGAFILYFALNIMAWIILFNTTIESVYRIIHNFLKQFVFRNPSLSPNLSGIKKPLLPSLPRKEFKVLGGNMFGGKDEEKPGVPPQSDRESQEKPQIKLPAVSPANLPPASTPVTNAPPGEAKIWKYPSIDLLSNAASGKADRGDIKKHAHIIEQTLESFGVTAQVVEVNLGPAVTQYAIQVAIGTKLSKITGLERDLALRLAAPTGTIRIEAPIPGRDLVGVELPNRAPEFVTMRRMMESDSLKNNPSKIAVALGLDVSGKPIVGDLGKMPHVMIAGQTGSGKSVCINTFLATLLLRASPSEVKLIMVDPKRVELTGYNGIPHLLAPVIVEPDKVISALRWVQHEMENRYKLFADAGVRNLQAYNESLGYQALPYIILLIDELADIMLFSPVEVEDAITRIAQMSRATGIHMVLATQRPSVDVITGLIKANIPTRIAFAVSSQVDSRVILDGQGAEKLLGKGDMLYMPPDAAKPSRIQGAFISDHDINALVNYVKNQGVPAQYTDEVTSMPRTSASRGGGSPEGEVDDLFHDAARIVISNDKASASLLQRKLSVGYARAAKLLDQLEAAGIIGQADGSKARDVLIKDIEQIMGGQGGEQASV